MTSSVILLTALFACDQTPDRKSHPLAPSLPLLSKEEYQAFEKVVDRFIQADTGKLTGADKKKAIADFKKLGSEAVFQLIEGFNRAANMEDSCPAVIIARKLSMIINSTSDLELLSFLKETIGLEVTAKRHVNVVRDLKFSVQMRRAAVQRQVAANKGLAGKALRSMTLAELTRAAGKERGQALKNVLSELEKRAGPSVLDTLAIVAANANSDGRDLAKTLLVKNLYRQKTDKLKEHLKHDSAEVRAAAARTIGSKRLRWGDELIGLLDDADRAVRQDARKALVRVSGGADYGPAPDASADDRAEAVRHWREWWTREKKTPKKKAS